MAIRWTKGRGIGASGSSRIKTSSAASGGTFDQASGGDTLSPAPRPAYHCGIVSPLANAELDRTIEAGTPASAGVVPGELVLPGMHVPQEPRQKSFQHWRVRDGRERDPSCLRLIVQRCVAPFLRAAGFTPDFGGTASRATVFDSASSAARKPPA